MNCAFCGSFGNKIVLNKNNYFIIKSLQQKIHYFELIQVNFYLQAKKFSLKIETKSNISWWFVWAFSINYSLYYSIGTAFWVLLSEFQYSKGTPMTYIHISPEYRFEKTKCSLCAAHAETLANSRCWPTVVRYWVNALPSFLKSIFGKTWRLLIQSEIKFNTFDTFKQMCEQMHFRFETLSLVTCGHWM